MLLYYKKLQRVFNFRDTNSTKLHAGEHFIRTASKEEG